MPQTRATTTLGFRANTVMMTWPYQPPVKLNPLITSAKMKLIIMSTHLYCQTRKECHVTRLVAFLVPNYDVFFKKRN